jgi:putative DNA primase/helicase
MPTLRETFYDGCTGYLDLRAIKAGKIKRQAFQLDDDRGIRSFIAQYGKDHDLYFGVATRDAGGGKKENIVEIPAVWVDVDFKDIDQAEAERRLNEFPIKPTVIVESGGGLHIYYVFKEPCGKDDIDQCEAVMRGLAMRLGGDLASTDASRILRIPATKNQKYDPPRQVILRYHNGSRYNLSDFDDFAAEPKDLSPSAQPRATSNLDAIMACKFMQHCRDDAATLKEPEWYAMVTILAREPGGVALIHELSKPHKGYKKGHTSSKIMHALNDSGPMTCEAIKSKCGFDCGRECKVKSPAALPFAATKEANRPVPSIKTPPHIQETTGLKPARTITPEELSKWGDGARAPDSFTADEVWQACNSQQDGDAWLFMRLFRKKLCYDHASGRWYCWSGHHWVEDTVDEVIAKVDIIIDIYQREAQAAFSDATTATMAGLKDERKRSEARQRKYLNKIGLLQKRYWKKDVLALAAAGEHSLGIAGDQWDRHRYLIGCSNGVIELDPDFIFRAGQPEDYLRVVAPTRWEGVDVPCPAWDKFMMEVFSGDYDMTEFMQRLFGMALAAGSIEHTFPILWGDEGRNGKGTMLETLSEVLGPLSGSVQTELIMDSKAARSAHGPSPEIVDLCGKRLLWGSETQQGRRINSSLVKQLSGGDKLKGRAVFAKRGVEFKPTHTLFLLTNAKPQMDATDQALWDRIHLVEFKNRFVDDPGDRPNHYKRDKNLKDKLIQESSGILAWLVRGFLEWKEVGLDPPEKVKMATKSYRHDEDAIGKFIEECCVLGEMTSVRASVLYGTYEKWCKDNGQYQLSGRKFGEYMTRKFEKLKGDVGMIYHGIGLPYREKEENTDKNKSTK